jgi:hypothetical protein
MSTAFSNTLPRCPVCKKTDPCSEGSSNCSRCGSDLTKAAAAYAAACQHTIAAAASLRAGDSAEALGYAEYAWTLYHLPAIPPLACLAALKSRNLADLALWRTRFTGL